MRVARWLIQLKKQEAAPSTNILNHKEARACEKLYLMEGRKETGHRPKVVMMDTKPEVGAVLGPVGAKPGRADIRENMRKLNSTTTGLIEANNGQD